MDEAVSFKYGARGAIKSLRVRGALKRNCKVRGISKMGDLASLGKTRLSRHLAIQLVHQLARTS